MSERISKEIELLRTHFPNLDYVEAGMWIRIPKIKLPDGWGLTEIPIAFQFPPNGYPQSPFYGFYVPTGLRFNGTMPTNFTDPAPGQPPFGGTTWAFFSGNPELWSPQIEIEQGTNAYTWVQSIADRFREGQ